MFQSWIEDAVGTLLSIDPWAAAAYAAAFVLAAVMPGWRALLGLGLVLGFLIGTGFAYLHGLDLPGGGAVETGIALGRLLACGIGTLAGIATRALVLVLRRAGRSWRARLAVLLLGFLAPPGVAVVSLIVQA